MKDETRKLLEKAQRALGAAEALYGDGFEDFAAGRAYYAMFHTDQALLREKDLSYRKHSSVHAAFGEHFAKTGLLDPKFHRWLLDAFDERIVGDYGIEVEFESDSVAVRIEQAREFLETARRFLEEPK
ncbi:MAG: HEPN domain-containing protein [Halothiobacillaceae bacterium]